MSHTKGPWTIEQNCILGEGATIAAIPLSMAHPDHYGTPEATANAYLISAAPEMLDDLLRLRRQIQWVIDNCAIDHDAKTALINASTECIPTLNKAKGVK